MSAYALPGLFPPIEGLSLSSSNASTCSGNVTQTSCSSSNESSSSCSTATPEQCSQTVPLHETRPPYSSSYATTSRINVLGDAVKASVDKLSHMLITGETTSSSNHSSESVSPDSPGIAVREAKIDPVRLVQCVTSTPQSKQQGKTLRKRNSLEKKRQDPSNPLSKNHQPSKDNNPHDEAIEFELSISFNGRKYTATRTLQCIVQLRNDLIREMNTRKQWLHTQCGVNKTPPPAPTSSPSSRRTTRSSSTPTQQNDAFEIPEIPPLDGERHENNHSGGGFVGRGFSMLHAMATSYVPVMEGWLRNVLTIVPQDSECLINFLWEPMNDMPALESAFPSFPSMSGLDSIKELDYNTGDDDDDHVDDGDSDDDGWER